MFLFSIFRIKTVRKVTIFKSLVSKPSTFYHRTLALYSTPRGKLFA